MHLDLDISDMRGPIDGGAILKNRSDVFAEELMRGAAQTRIIPVKRIKMWIQTKKSTRALTYQNKKCDGSSHTVNGRVSMPSPPNGAV